MPRLPTLLVAFVEGVKKNHDTTYNKKRSGRYGCTKMFSHMAGSNIASK